MFEKLGSYRVLWVLGLIFVVLATFLYIHWSINGPLNQFAQSQYDDAYITYRYAANASNGHGLVFNLGDQTNSASSFLWTLILIPVFRFFEFGTPQIAQLLLILCHLALAGCVFTYVGTLSKHKSGILIAIAASLFVSLSGPTIYWTLSGMETTLFLLLISLGMLSTRHLIRTSTLGIRSVISLTVLGLLTICRFEGIALSLILSIFILIARVNVKQSAFGTSRILLTVLPLCTTLITSTSLIVFYKFYYNSLIPDPITFKRLVSYYSQSVGDAVYQILGYSHDWIGLPVLALFVFALAVILKNFTLKRFRECEAWIELIPLIAICALGGFLLASAYSDYYRYQLVLIVPLTLTIAVGFTNLINNSTSHEVSAAHKWIFGRISLALVLVFIASTLIQTRSFIRSISATTERFLYLQEARVQLGKYMESHLPPGSRVLSGDLGALSFYNLSDVYIDSAGLTNRTLLNGIQNGEPYSEIIRIASPQYLADSMLPSGVSGTESMFGTPQKYYDSNEILVKSRCELRDLYSLKRLKKYPEKGEFPLYVSLWQLELNATSRCSV